MTKRIEKREFRGGTLYLQHRDATTGLELWSADKAMANKGMPVRNIEPSVQEKYLRAYKGPRPVTARESSPVTHCEDHTGFTDGCDGCAALATLE